MCIFTEQVKSGILNKGIADLYKIMQNKKIVNVGVSAPADYIDKTNYYNAEKIFKDNYSINLIPGKNLFNKHGCFAGTDTERLSDINDFISDTSIDAVFFAKGGYGSAALLPYIDYETLKKNPKIFIGYSDITSLLIAINSLTNSPAFYGPMVTSDFYKPLHELTQYFFDNIVINNKEITITEEKSAEFKVIKSVEDVFTGYVTGGCLTVFNTLLGTPYLKIKDDSILFLEDTNEEVYRIDRQINHIINSGIINKCISIILDFSNCKISHQNKDTIPLNQRLLEIFHKYDINIIRWDCFGHRFKKIILPIGKKMKFNLKKKEITFFI